MRIDRADAAGSRPPESGFTGDIAVSGYFVRAAPSRLCGAIVHFAPGARTPWKTNPLGQTLVVTHGTGRAQVAGEPVVALRVGDVVWFPPGVRHWEGADPDVSMTYVAVQEADGDSGVTFGESVTDAEYSAVLRSE